MHIERDEAYRAREEQVGHFLITSGSQRKVDREREKDNDRITRKEQGGNFLIITELLQRNIGVERSRVATSQSLLHFH